MSLVVATPGGSPQFLGGNILGDSVVMPPQAGAVNNLNGDIAIATTVLLRLSAAATISGMRAPPGGGAALRWLVNDSSFAATFLHASGLSDAVNRFNLGGADLSVPAGVVCGFLYNTRTALWDLFTIGMNPGAANASIITGSFTATLTGCTTSPTGTVNYTKNVITGLVTLQLPSITATSNATSATLTGVPSVVQPNATVRLYTPVRDNGARLNGGTTQTAASGTITLNMTVLASGVLSSTGFTASGTKGVDETTLTYLAAAGAT